MFQNIFSLLTRNREHANSIYSFYNSIYYFIPQLLKCVYNSDIETIDKLNILLPQCWAESPSDTLKIIFYKRDCRGGEGDKNFFLHCFKWIVFNHYEVANKYIYFIPFFGCYKDLLYLLDTPISNKVYIIFANQLKLDLETVNRCKEQNDYFPISLASKWCPSIGSHYDKKFNFCKKLSFHLNYTDKKYQEFIRKQYLSPLREHLKITERLVSQQRWNEINYYSVPKLSMKKFVFSFLKHDQAKFIEWLNQNNTDHIFLDKIELKEMITSVDDVLKNPRYINLDMHFDE